jgi:hypothetical protein
MGWDGMSMDLAKEIYAKKAEIFTGIRFMQTTCSGALQG